jgi:kinesin family protein 5
MSTHQRKRITEMLTNLLKDLSEIGLAIGGDGEIKVWLKLLNTSKTF